jgi:hypothetical protein
VPRRTTAQLNIRSSFARTRVRAIARQTGMTATEIVEDALRGYVPTTDPEPVGTLVRRGKLLVRPAPPGRTITQDEAEAALAAARDRPV